MFDIRHNQDGRIVSCTRRLNLTSPHPSTEGRQLEIFQESYRQSNPEPPASWRSASTNCGTPQPSYSTTNKQITHDNQDMILKLPGIDFFRPACGLQLLLLFEFMLEQQYPLHRNCSISTRLLPQYLLLSSLLSGYWNMSDWDSASEQRHIATKTIILKQALHIWESNRKEQLDQLHQKELKVQSV